MQEFIVRDSDEKIIARVRKVLNSDAADKLEGERTLRFTTLLDEGLERLRDEGKYTVEFDDDLYDVVSFQKSMSGNLCFIDISCEHIAYRLNEHKKEYFSQTGTAKEILISMLADTGFVVGDNVPVKTMTYSSQQSATVRAMLLDFAGINGWDVVFHRFTVSVVPHRGSVLDTKILQGNVLEISKTINVTESTAAYSLKLRPKTPVAVGDEVHLVFDRLGIDDKVRVLAIKRQPFISEDITLEVGAYEPTLESESAQVRTDMITENKSYYGTRISAENGLEIHRDDSLAKVVFNADKMAFYQGNEEILYFDAAARKWKMAAAMEVHVSDGEGGETTMNALADGLTTRIQDADNHYVEIKQTIDGFTVKTEEGETLIDGGMIITDNLQLHRLISKGSPNSYVEMLTNGLNFVLGNANTIGIGYASAEIPLPYIIFGEGASPKSDESGMIKFYDGGLWIGDSADRHSKTIQSGTGLFIDVPNDQIFIYKNGECNHIANFEELKAYVDQKIAEYVPVAVFG